MDKYSRERKYSKSKRPNRHCGQQIGGTQRHNGLNHYRNMGTILHKQKSQRRRAIGDDMKQEAADYGETCYEFAYTPVQIQYQLPFDSFNNSKTCNSGMGRHSSQPKTPRIWYSNKTGREFDSKKERWEAEGDEHRVQETSTGYNTLNYWYNRDTKKYQTFPNNKLKRLKL
jgi:hypothetical protein